MGYLRALDPDTGEWITEPLDEREMRAFDAIRPRLRADPDPLEQLATGGDEDDHDE